MAEVSRQGAVTKNSKTAPKHQAQFDLWSPADRPLALTRIAAYRLPYSQTHLSSAIIPALLYVVFAATHAMGRIRRLLGLCPLVRGISVLGQRIGHGIFKCSINSLLPPDFAQPLKMIRNNHCLVVGFLTPAVHVAFINNLKKGRLQCLQCGSDFFQHHDATSCEL